MNICCLQYWTIAGLLFVASFGAFGQSAPLFREGPVKWVASQDVSGGRVGWFEVRNGEAVYLPIDQASSPGDHLLNFHPALTMPEGKVRQWSLNEIDLQAHSLFLVYRVRDTAQEYHLWSLERADTTQIVTTSRRTADLARFSFLNYPDLDGHFPAIHTYWDHQRAPQRARGNGLHLRFGAPAPFPQLPVSGFAGQLPEWLFFDRVLSPRERIQVETYLSLKYAIPLQQREPPLLLSSRADTLWSGEEAQHYLHRITGLGRDDGSGLYQKQSASTREPGLMTLGLDTIAASNRENPATLQDQAFLLWADNDGPLTLSRDKPWEVPALGRRWQVRTQGDWKQQATDLRIRQDALDAARKEDERWWLLVDRAGKGSFDPAQTEFFASRAEAELYFDDLQWDPDGSGKDVFTLVRAPDFFIFLKTGQPLCGGNARGYLEVLPVGGKPPYRLEIRSEGLRQSREWGTAQSFRWEDLAPGEYHLLASDGQGRRFESTFFLSHAGASRAELPKELLLPESGTRWLDAFRADSPSTQYEWITPSGARSYSSALEITGVGTYQLITRQGGCVSWQQIQVSRAGNSPFQRVRLYPNPARQTPFFLEVALEAASELKMSIHDMAGKQIRSVQWPKRQYHRIRERIGQSGTFLISLQAAGAERTLRVVVE